MTASKEIEVDILRPDECLFYYDSSILVLPFNKNCFVLRICVQVYFLKGATDFSK